MYAYIYSLLLLKTDDENILLSKLSQKCDILKKYDFS